MIVQWVVIAVFIIIGLYYLKFEHHAKKIKIVIFLVLGFALYFSLISHFNSDNVDLTSPRGVVNGIYLYVGWLGQTASSLWNIGSNTVTLVGNAIKINDTQPNQPRR